MFWRCWDGINAWTGWAIRRPDDPDKVLMAG
jgi:hypothetical protein